MILETGKPGNNLDYPGARRGFTLIEILLVIIIIGLVASIAVVQFGDSMEDSLKSKAINLLVMEAVFNARLYAKEKREPTHLSYNGDEVELQITTADGSAIETIKCNYEGQDDPVIEFLPLMSMEFTGSVSFNYEYGSEPLPYIYFGPTGISTPVSVRITSDHYNGTMRLDAFSTMVLKEELR